MTDRILNVIKNFDSIKNPEKVSVDLGASPLCFLKAEHSLWWLMYVGR